MKSLYNLYLNNDILNICESFMEEQGDLKSQMTDEDRIFIESQISDILDMITTQLKKYPNDEAEAIDIIVDKLIGYCVISKISESILCRTVNELQDENEKLKGK